jgi:hypothetical protein
VPGGNHSWGDSDCRRLSSANALACPDTCERTMLYRAVGFTLDKLFSFV